MTQPAPSQPPSNVSNIPQVVITETKFEGEEVQATTLTLAGTAKLTPRTSPGNDDHRVVAIGDILTVQVDVKVTSIGYETDAKGQLTRTQRCRPIEGVADVLDVVRRHNTKIR